MTTVAGLLSAHPGRPRITYICEGFCTVSGHLLSYGIFFYTQRQFGWGSRENLSLAAMEGVFYVVGALLASPISRRLGRRRTLILMNALCALALVGCSVAGAIGPLAVAGLILFETVCVAMTWPILESLVSTGCDAETLARRLGIYNLVWSGFGVVTLAACGLLVQYAAGFFFIVPAAAHVAIFVLMWRTRDVEPAETQVHVHIDPEPGLLKKRRLALGLSRLALPATFVVAYSFGAVLPNLPSMAGLAPSVKTVIASVWLASRWAAFLILGGTVFWHTRPRLLLGATAVMLVAFIVTTLRPVDLFGIEAGYTSDLLCLIGGQLVLGLALGLIYSASLYFGMVLSQGSTEHGGYHEALIGAGQAVGPAIGLVAQIAYGGSLTAAIIAIAGLLGVTMVVSGVVSVEKRVDGKE